MFMQNLRVSCMLYGMTTKHACGKNVRLNMYDTDSYPYLRGRVSDTSTFIQVEEPM